MFLQNFKNYVSYDLTTFTTTYKFQLSTSNTLNFAYIGAAIMAADDNPFTALYGAQEQIYINTDYFHYKTTIGGQLGFQGNVQFQVSLLGQYVLTFEQDCMTKLPGTLYRSCEDAPIYATNYFNQSEYYSYLNTPTYSSPYSGYNSSGYIYSTSVCAVTAGAKYFCTIGAASFYVADSVYGNNWNYDSAAAAGIMGFGKNSPLWTIVGTPATKEFDVYMANYNSWTWADSTWTPTTMQSVMNIGGFSNDYVQSDAHTSFNPAFSGSYLLPLATFGFGMYNATNSSEFYEDLMNFDTDLNVYGIH